jgi:hypothetical protein
VFDESGDGQITMPEWVATFKKYKPDVSEDVVKKTF